MKFNKIKIIAPFAHFGVPLTSKKRNTYISPPPSTVLGILKVLFGETIDNFKFGYTFKYESQLEDLITKYKIDIKELKKKIPFYNLTTDACIKEYLWNCELIIYTNLNTSCLNNMNHILTLGQADCIAKLKLPIEEIELINKEGKIYNQYTDISIGTGQIKPITIFTQFNTETQSYDSKISHLRFNTEVPYNKFYNEETQENIYVWSKKGDGINVC
ncbi:MAG: CRISPR-associated protein Cas5 [Bacilli bacterium]